MKSNINLDPNRVEKQISAIVLKDLKKSLPNAVTHMSIYTDIKKEKSLKVVIDANGKKEDIFYTLPEDGIIKTGTANHIKKLIEEKLVDYGVK